MFTTSDDITGDDTIDWMALTARAGRAGHDLVGRLMWGPDAIARSEAPRAPNGAGHHRSGGQRTSL